MKSLAKFTWVLVSALAAASLIACAKAGPNTNNNPGGYYPPYGNGCYNGVCNQTNNQLAYYSQNSLMDQYYQSMGYQANSNAAMNVGSGHRQAMKYAMGVCDRNHSDSGVADCGTWMNGYHDFVIVANSLSASTVKVVVRSYPNVNYANWYSVSLPSFSQFVLGAFGFNTYNAQGIYNPMILTMTINPINGNKGFELRGYGPQGSLASGLLYQIQVLNGKLEDSNFAYTMYFNSEVAMSGSMARCSTLNCGLPFAL